MRAPREERPERLSDVLRSAERGASPAEELPAQRAPEPLRVGAADDPAERAADEMADRALRRLRPALDPGAERPEPAAVHRAASGGALAGAFDAATDVADRIRGRSGRGSALPTDVRRSMEQGFGRGLGDVRVHTDAESAALADSLGAEAFTLGRDVFFGAGRFDPHSSEGEHLLAHELAHVVQGAGGAQRQLHRKLKGTRQAVTDMAGKASVGMRLKGSDYPKILSKLDDYEAKEAKVVAKRAFGKGDREWMAKTLTDVVALIDGWTSRHDDDEKRRVQDKNYENHARDKYMTAKQTQDFAAMAREEDLSVGNEERRRVSALRMLRPRVVLERSELSSPAYFTIATRADSALKQGSGWTQDNAVGGAMNRLDKVEYQDGKKGYFIRDKASPAEVATASEATGIDTYDPNQGARSVASSRLAKLFGAKEIVDVQFATHESATRYKGHSDAKATRRLGVFSEQAEGAEAASFAPVPGRGDASEFAQEGKQSVDLADPELQRSLNVLQMLDYISRQMDRHTKNFYIATDDKGRVVGVTGIDLDISFGGAGNNGGDLEMMGKAGHFVGLPQLADAQFRAKVLSVTAGEVRACLEGLLSDAEIAATVERFTHLQKALAGMDPKKVVPVGGWGAGTAQQQLATPEGNYLSKMHLGAMQELYDGKAPAAAQPLSVAGLSAEKREVLEAVERLVYTATLTPGQGLGLIEALALEITTDATLERLRQAKTGAAADENRAKTAVRALTAAKKAVLEEGGAEQETKLARVEAQMMAAEVEKEAVSVIRAAADKDYDAALKTLITTLSDFAVRVASRQKRAMAPVRRPARV